MTPERPASCCPCATTPRCSRCWRHRGCSVPSVGSTGPTQKRQSHCFYTRLAQQHDAVIHIDDTSAVKPLDVGPVWIDGEVPETFPSGM